MGGTDELSTPLLFLQKLSHRHQQISRSLVSLSTRGRNNKTEWIVFTDFMKRVANINTIAIFFERASKNEGRKFFKIQRTIGR